MSLLSKFGNEGKSDKWSGQGKNASETYTVDREKYIAIGVPVTNQFLKFKAFITDFSRLTQTNYEENLYATAKAPRYIKGAIENQIRISFDVPAHSVNEARLNLEKIQYMCQNFLSVREGMEGYSRISNQYTIHVLFSNLIHKVGSKNFTADNFSEVETRGEECIFTDFSFEIDTESGFFEGDASYGGLGKLIPRKVSITMGLVPIIKKTTTETEAEFIERYNNTPGLDPATPREKKLESYQAGKKSNTVNPFPYFSDNMKRGEELAYPFGIEYSPGESVTPEEEE